MSKNEAFKHVIACFKKGCLHTYQGYTTDKSHPVTKPLAFYCLQGTSKNLSQVARGSYGVLCCSSLPTSTGVHVRAVDIEVFRLRKWGVGGG